MKTLTEILTEEDTEELTSTQDVQRYLSRSSIAKDPEAALWFAQNNVEISGKALEVWSRDGKFPEMVTRMRRQNARDKARLSALKQAHPDKMAKAPELEPGRSVVKGFGQHKI